MSKTLTAKAPAQNLRNLIEDLRFGLVDADHLHHAPPRYRVDDRCGITFTIRHDSEHCRDCKSVI